MAQTKPTKKAADAPKVMDVKKTSAASPTSRQVIVENRSITQDPMMAQISKLTGSTSSASATDPIPGEVGPVEHMPEATGAPALTPSAKKVAIKITRDNKAAQQTEEVASLPTDSGPSLPPSKKRVVIQPISATESDKATAEAPADVSPVSKTTKSEPTIAELAKPDPLEGITPNPEKVIKDDEATPTEAEKESKPEDKLDEAQAEDKTTDANTSPSPAQSDEANTDSEVKESSETNEPEDAADSVVVTGIDEKDDKKKQKKTPKNGELTAEQQKAVEAEEYFLPITTAETRRLHRELLFATLFILVALVIWFDIMLDAELIKINGVKAVTNFFK